MSFISICNADQIITSNYVIEPGSIYDIMKVDSFSEKTISFSNIGTTPIRFGLSLRGNISELVRFDKERLTIQPGSTEYLKTTVFASEEGEYNGSIEIGEIEVSIPYHIKVYDPDKLPVSALYIEIDSTEESVNQGDVFRYRVNIYNLLVEKKYNATLDYTISSSVNGTEKKIYEEHEEVEVRTSDSLLREFKIESNMSIGTYVLKVDAQYLNLTSSASNVFFVTLPYYSVTFLGVEIWQYALFLVMSMLFYWGFKFYRKKQESKKRYHTKTELKLLPKPGPRSAYIGKIAESEHKTYLDLDKLTTHTIVAGSTGGGKTVAAQDIVEEALLKGVAVVVFDPTAQWSGMLRKCDNQRMLGLFPNFGMKASDAKAFNGNVRAITDAREIIDIRKYLKPGEIQIFTVNKLDPKDIDVFVANTVAEVFHANFPEEQQLKYMIVYDEVHRLLPKFGGSGQGFIQIERACREFRKWGIGVLLISQVLADFVGQIKANINTEIQMRTRDEGDLKRIATKYSEDLLRSLVKSSVGTGMVQNSAYNRGLPYFVAFRPMLHSIKRLSDEELEQYNKYNEKIDDYEYQLEQLEQEKQDVFDLRLELKLALDKLKSGSFNMVEIYLEGLDTRLKGEWKKLGKTPKKRELVLIKEEILEDEMKKAQEARKKFMEDENKTAEKSKQTEILLFKKIFTPLTFDNGAMISTLQELTDALRSMDDEIFENHVNSNKNDIYAWLNESVKDDELTKGAKLFTSRIELLSFLEKEKTKKRKVAEAEAKKEGVGKADKGK
ncbi:DUF853 family protein, partial [Candidatus Woesearchaeota archaeon]|nr:DUF853 family protein [Candidatus Woesearchaeota archaeon]